MYPVMARLFSAGNIVERSGKGGLEVFSVEPELSGDDEKRIKRQATNVLKADLCYPCRFKK